LGWRNLYGGLKTKTQMNKQKIKQKLVSISSFIDSNKYFKTVYSNPILSIILLILFSIFIAFPSYDLIFQNIIGKGWDGIFFQLNGIIVDMAAHFPDYSHESKLTFRFTPAIFMNFLGLSTLTEALIFQLIIHSLFFICLYDFFYKNVGNKKYAFLFCFPICSVMAGHVFASDAKGYFEVMALFFLVFSLWLNKNNFLIIITLLFAYFTDERALVASPVIILIQLIITKESLDNKNVIKQLFSYSSLLIYLSWIFYFIIRLGLTHFFDLTISTGGTDFFFKQLHLTFYALFFALEFYFILFVIFIYHLIQKKYLYFLVLFIASFLLLFAVTLAVFDIDRSVSYFALLLILLSIGSYQFIEKKYLLALLVFIGVGNIMFDLYLPLPLQIIRAFFISKSIPLPF
jgi:hypothetical protein